MARWCASERGFSRIDPEDDTTIVSAEMTSAGSWGGGEAPLWEACAASASWYEERSLEVAVRWT
jgi:hypothetical protein